MDLVIPTGRNSAAESAGPPSPVNPPNEGAEKPLPATVMILPDALILRMRSFSSSAIYTLPMLSATSPLGALNSAPDDGPQSPA